MIDMGMRQQHVVNIRRREGKWFPVQIAADFALMHAAVNQNLLI